MQYLKLFNGEEQKQIRNFQFHLRDTESWKEHHCQAHDKKKLQSMAISSVPQRTENWQGNGDTAIYKEEQDLGLCLTGAGKSRYLRSWNWDSAKSVQWHLKATCGLTWEYEAPQSRRGRKTCTVLQASPWTPSGIDQKHGQSPKHSPCVHTQTHTHTHREREQPPHTHTHSPHLPSKIN